MNTKIFDEEQKRTVEVNESSERVPPEVLSRLLTRLKSVLNAGDVVILSGSLPTGAAPDTYAAWCRALREKGARVIADCSGRAML